jgi:hypothetical protein
LHDADRQKLKRESHEKGAGERGGEAVGEYAKKDSLKTE